MRVVGKVAVRIVGVVGGDGVVKAGGVFGQGGGAAADLRSQGGRAVRFITEAVFKGDCAGGGRTQVDAGVLHYTFQKVPISAIWLIL